MRTLPFRPLTLAALLPLLACGGGGGGSTPPPPVVSAPTLTGMSPTQGSPGTTVTLTGTSLTGASAVSFNGRAAFAYSVVSSTQITAVVPSGATTGPITVTTSAGSATSAPFTVEAALAPTLTSFTPAVLSAGSSVTLTGTHFVGATAVQFNGVNAASFAIASDTQIQATAPTSLTAGYLTVTTPAGTATSATAYTVGASAQPLLNTSFEDSAPLIWQGDTGIIYPNLDATYAARTGTQFAYLGGYGTTASDQITQDVYLPASTLAATATFYVKILTAETSATGVDTFTVTARDASGNLLGTLLTKSNLDASSAYVPFTVNLLPYKGRILRLTFTSQENASSQTSFLLDDVTASLSVPAASDLAPLITTFTPTSGIAGETTVQVTGGNFFGLTAAMLGGASASPVLTDGTKLSLLVPAGATGTGPITLTNAQGTGTSTGSFAVVYGAPVIASMNPTAGPVGTPVVITGAYLGYPGTTLSLNGQAITGFSQSTSQITFTIPAGATSGNLVVSSPGGTATRAFTVNTAATTLDFHVDRVQLTQSTQTLANTVPILAGKAALARVFVLANQSNSATPSVRLTLLNNGVAVAGYPKTLAAPLASVPLTLNEGSLTSSWNLAIPAADLTTPLGSGYTVEATVDPTGALAEADETNNTTTATFAGTTVPPFKSTIFPVVLSSGTGNITEANKAEWVARLAKMFPVAGVEVLVGAPFTPSVSSIASDGTGWDTVLNDLTTKHLADGASDRYYYGALKVSYGGGVAGLGWVPNTPSADFRYRTAIGWDKTGYSDGGNFPEVFAHETGHNMGRAHSPCGGAGGPDPAYPYADGLIGVWGYDTVLNQLYAPLTYKDIMGYCTPNWVSDYVYQKILAFRDPAAGGFLKAGAEDDPLPKEAATPRECLIVRGILHADGRTDLLPAFRTRALPTLPPSTGTHHLELRDDQGAMRFSTPVTWMEVGCAPQGHEQHFVMALPLEASLLDAVTSLVLLQDGKAVSQKQGLARSARPVATAPEARRLAKDRTLVTWDATLHPAVMVRDADTGEVLAILSGGQQTIPATARHLDLVLSDGVGGPTLRLDLTR